MPVSQADTTAQSEVRTFAKGSDSLCLSMRMLGEIARPASSRGGDLAASRTCYGLNFIKGYVIDDAHNDIVLYGSRIESRPPILLDDLCVCMQNIWHAERLRYVGHQYPYPFCSLDPQKGAMAEVDRAIREIEVPRLENDAECKRAIQKLADALGPQQVRIGGVPGDVRLARAMIDADYHMKKVSQGHLTVPGVQSCSRLGLERQKHPPLLFVSLGRMIGIKPALQRSRMSRFWFHLDKNHPTFVETSGMVEIENCAMVVLTERQVSARDGSLVDGGDDDPDAQAFAESMSSQLRRGTTGVKEYTDLENLYQLFALLKAIQFKRAETAVGLELSPLLDYQAQRIEMPQALPALANIETDIEETQQAKRWYCSFVCGGVNMDASLTPRRFKASRDGQLVKTKHSIVRSRPSTHSIFWVSHEVA